MIPRSVSRGSWTRGLRTLRALAFEAARFVFAVWLALTLIFLTFQVWSSGLGLLGLPHNPQYAGTAAENIDIFALT